jgi:hypothetical protein
LLSGKNNASALSTPFWERKDKATFVIFQIAVKKNKVKGLRFGQGVACCPFAKNGPLDWGVWGAPDHFILKFAES